MRRSLQHAASSRPCSTAANLIQIRNGTFFKEHPSNISISNKVNAPLFPNLTFDIPATSEQDADTATRKTPHWAVIGTSPTTFLNVLKGEYLCIPPNARTFPHLASEEIARKDPRLRVPSRAIQYVGFQGGGGSLSSGVTGAYLSARYESRREETDWTVLQYLTGDTELNPSEELSERVRDNTLLDRVVRDLRLQKLLNMPVSNLSNGQTRRSRIAKALLSKPELLLLDEPFMGLDPPTLVSLSPILRDLAWKASPLLVLGLRPQDPVPDWITHLVVLAANDTVALMGSKAQVLFSLYHWIRLSQGREEGQEGPMLQQKLTALLDGAYGKPLTKVGDSLTARGVVPYTAYKDARLLEPKLWSADGKVQPDLLSEHSRTAWLQADQKAEKDRTVQDYLTLTSSIPEHLEDTSSDFEITSGTGAPSATPGTTQPATTDVQVPDNREPLIELSSIVIKYGPKTVLGFPPAQPGYTEPGLNLTIRQGTRLALLGPNGSGKTTLLSLLTSDHPQSYSLPIRFFGRTRLPAPGKPGLSLWEIQSRIGHSSPEVHAFFPKGLTVRQVLESAWAETFSSKPVLDADRNALVDHVLRHFAPELRHGAVTDTGDLSWASDRVSHPPFGRLDFGTQRLLLFLRAIIKSPDIIILDEAFSGLSNATRDKALVFMQEGTPDSAGSSIVDGVRFEGLKDSQALVVVSHVREEVPGCVREWVRLPSEEEALELGVAVRMGTIAAGDVRSVEGWNAVWGL